MTRAKHLNLSRRGALFIGAFEGFVPHLYDIFGNAHIGFGHMLHLGPYTAEDVHDYGGWVNGQPGFIDRESAGRLLIRDAHPVVEGIQDAIPNVELRQAQFDALVSPGFNLGPYWFGDSPLPDMLRAGEFARARRELLRYDHATIDGELVRVPGLTKRRRAEAVLYRSGNYFLGRLLGLQPRTAKRKVK